MKTLEEQAAALREEKERLHSTELLAEEAKRLADGEGDPRMHTGGNQVLIERVNSLEQENSEVRLERDRLRTELENAKEDAHNARKALEDEIQSLRERESQK